MLRNSEHRVILCLSRNQFSAYVPPCSADMKEETSKNVSREHTKEPTFLHTHPFLAIEV